MDIKFDSPDNGITTICSIEYNGQTFLGIAKCAETDLDMKTTFTGQRIAQARAIINLKKYIRDYEIKPALKILKRLYYTMYQSPKFNKDSYENKILQREIHRLESQLAVIKEMIAMNREDLKDFIDAKEILYQALR